MGADINLNEVALMWIKGMQTLAQIRLDENDEVCENGSQLGHQGRPVNREESQGREGGLLLDLLGEVQQLLFELNIFALGI